MRVQNSSDFNGTCATEGDKRHEPSPSNSTLADHESYGRSIDLTHLLRGDHAKPVTTDKSYDLPFPSALPAPLYGHMNGGVPLMASPPDPANILTHFDVVHHHLRDATSSVHRSITMAREDVTASVLAKHEDSLKVLEEHFGDMRAQLNAVEHNMGRVTGECETQTAKLDKIVDTIKHDVVDVLTKSAKANADLAAKLDAMNNRIRELEKKLEAPPARRPDSPAISQSSNAFSASHSPPSYPMNGMQWGNGYAVPMTRQQVQQMDPYQRRAIFTSMGQQMGAPDINQHPAYANQNGHGYGGNAYDYSTK